jgi:protein phosphatase
MTEEFSNKPLRSNSLSEGPSESAPPASAAVVNATETQRGPLARRFVSFNEPADKVVTSTVHSASHASTHLRIAVSAMTDVGCVRTNNEDSYGYDESLGIFVVCDGMGGVTSGEVASSRAVMAIINSFADSASSDIPVDTRLLDAIRAANLDVWENGQVPENKGMGTTAVVAALDGDKLIVGNVGDSRAYSVQGANCSQLTVDHSLIGELIRNGTLTLDSAQKADIPGMRSVVTRAVGVAPEVQADFFSVDFRPGTAVLLATDGLTVYVRQGEIGAVLASSPPEFCCANLIALAKQRGGQDNITCVLLRALPA